MLHIHAAKLPFYHIQIQTCQLVRSLTSTELKPVLKLLLIYDMFYYHGGCCEWKKGPAKAKVRCAFCALVTIVVIWVMVSFLPHLIWPLSSELIHQQGAAICRPAVCYGIPTILIKLKKPPKTISHTHTTFPLHHIIYHTWFWSVCIKFQALHSCHKIGDWINTWIFRQKGITF